MVTSLHGGKLLVNGKLYTDPYKVRVNVVDLDKDEYLLSNKSQQDIRNGKSVAVTFKPTAVLIQECSKLSEGEWFDGNVDKPGYFPQITVESDGAAPFVTFEIQIGNDLYTPRDVAKHQDGITTSGFALHIEVN